MVRTKGYPDSRKPELIKMYGRFKKTSSYNELRFSHASVYGPMKPFLSGNKKPTLSDVAVFEEEFGMHTPAHLKEYYGISSTKANNLYNKMLSKKAHNI